MSSASGSVVVAVDAWVIDRPVSVGGKRAHIPSSAHRGRRRDPGQLDPGGGLLRAGLVDEVRLRLNSIIFGCGLKVFGVAQPWRSA